ncbi:hypothetical protein LTR70_007847 [Exophiala xenobiotica]|uniref:Uncharacterized protein n=1 Tax=Lithohypha guttulata TaxID=1690604 RepID=A0ABR0JZY1_9EURO|nr:hypothetical protein LTR24_008542 [Lithohypha guttulata]KAK5313007.1 hypothetical protein LTR70_007847 [Exophiala xenobiotica]
MPSQQIQVHELQPPTGKRNVLSLRSGALDYRLDFSNNLRFRRSADGTDILLSIYRDCLQDHPTFPDLDPNGSIRKLLGRWTFNCNLNLRQSATSDTPVHLSIAESYGNIFGYRVLVPPKALNVISHNVLEDDEGDEGYEIILQLSKPNQTFSAPVPNDNKELRKHPMLAEAEKSGYLSANCLMLTLKETAPPGTGSNYNPHFQVARCNYLKITLYKSSASDKSHIFTPNKIVEYIEKESASSLGSMNQNPSTSYYSQQAAIEGELQAK